MARCLTTIFAAIIVSATTAGPAVAQESNPDINWQECPCDGDLGVATVRVPAGLLFADKVGTVKFLEATQNPTSGSERGVVAHSGGTSGTWFVVFSFNESGYVRDDDKYSLNADQLLKSIREGTEASNRERVRRGWSPLSVDGWARPPFYDPATSNLTWAIRGSSGAEGEVVNHSVRLLGRRGVINADLVTDPSVFDRAVPEFNQVVAGFDFKAGQRYREFTAGDRVAEYGLAALIAGGTAAVATKTGFWKAIVALLAAGWKVVVAAFLGLGAWIKNLFKRRRE